MPEQPPLFPEPDAPTPTATPPQADAVSDAALVAQVYAIARAIPSGRVMSYGAVGARCQPPISGYICGRIMNNVAADVPWWRVVAKDGALPISKRNPLLAQEQRSKLEAEGVTFDATGHILASCFEGNHE